MVTKGTVELISITGDPITGVPGRPHEHVELARPRPNPFNPSTVLELRVHRPGVVQLLILDARGRRVRTLVDRWLNAGVSSWRWEGTDDAGRSVASGVYRAVLNVDGELHGSRNLVLIE